MWEKITARREILTLNLWIPNPVSGPLGHAASASSRTPISTTTPTLPYASYYAQDWYQEHFATSSLHISLFSSLLGFGELQDCPFPGVVFPPLPLSVLSSFSFHCGLEDGFGQT